MDSMQTILDLSAGNVRILHAMLADIDPADICVQLPGISNHPAWQASHLTFVRSALLGMLGVPTDLPEIWAAQYGPGSTPVADPAKYLPKAELIATFDRHQAKLIDVLKQTPANVLDQPTAIERLRARFPTTRHLAWGMLTVHDGLHLGQLSVWRRARGLPRVI